MEMLEPKNYGTYSTTRAFLKGDVLDSNGKTFEFSKKLLNTFVRKVGAVK